MKKIVLFFLCLIFCLKSYGAQLKFAQVTDVHFSANGVQQQNSRDTSHTKQVLKWAVRSLNNKNPQFVVFMGDNIDKSDADELKEFLKITKDLKMPYYLAYGNHDAHENNGVKKEDFWKIVKQYNRNNTSKLGYYTFSPNRNFLCIVLDGSVPYSPTAHGIFPEEELKWLDTTLAKNKNKKVLIFQHFPLIDPDEHDSHTLLSKEEYQSILDKHNNVVSISSGHFHVQKVTIDKKGIYHIASPALVSPNYRYNFITIDYTKKLFSPVKINSIGIRDYDLQ